MVVNCVAYQDGLKVADISLGEIRPYTSNARMFRLGCAEGSGTIRIRRAARGVRAPRAGGRRRQAWPPAGPKIEEYAQSALRCHAFTIELDEDSAGGRGRGVRRPQLRDLVHTAANLLRGFGDVRRRCEDEPDLLRHGPAYVLYTLIWTAADRYFPVSWTSLTEEIDAARGTNLRRRDDARQRRSTG